MHDVPGPNYSAVQGKFEVEWFDAGGLRLPFLVYEVTDTPRPFYVFYCLWNDRGMTEQFAMESMNYGNRLASVLAGLRNSGQRSLEIAVGGVNLNAAQAEAAFQNQLQKIIQSGQAVCRRVD